MTDLNLDLIQQGGVGRQPITNAGRVAVNVYLDQDALEERKEKGTRDSPWPNANLDDKSFYIFQRDICLSKKRRPTRKASNNRIEVFAVLNGLQSEGMTHRQMIEAHTFSCIAGGQGAIFDTSGNNARWPNFAGVVGGLLTLVNTGPERIMNGDLFYWDFPAPGAEATMHRRESKRITPILRPYRASKQAATARAVCESVRNSFSSSATDTSTMQHGSPTDQAALRLKWAMLQLSVNAIAAALKSGVVQFSPDAATNATTRATNAAAYSRAGASAQEEFLAKIATGIGCRRTKDGSDKIQMPGSSVSLKQELCNLLTFDEKLCGYVDGTSVPSGPKGELLRNQESVVKDLLASVAEAQNFVLSRIIGKAMGPAAGGMEFDALIGHNRS